MKFIFTYSISQGPNSADIILEYHTVKFRFMCFCVHTHSHTQTPKLELQLLVKRQRDYKLLTQFITKAETLGHGITQKKQHRILLVLYISFQFDILVLDGGVSHRNRR